MKIIMIEEHLAGAPINRYLAKYSAEDAPYTAMEHGKGIQMQKLLKNKEHKVEIFHLD